MEELRLDEFFKGIVDSDEQAIVICNTEHIIVYMNPAAVKRYEKRGGASLVGKSVLDCHNPHSCDTIRRNIERMKNDKSVNKTFEMHIAKNGENSDLYTAAIRNGDGELIGYYEKHEDKNLYQE